MTTLLIGFLLTGMTQSGASGSLLSSADSASSPRYELFAQNPEIARARIDSPITDAFTVEGANQDLVRVEIRLDAAPGTLDETLAQVRPAMPLKQCVSSLIHGCERGLIRPIVVLFRR